MTDAQLEAVGKLCDLLRAKGVHIFEGAECKIELGPPELPARATESKLETEPVNCRCGHPLHAHNAGACLLGCSLEDCMEPEK